jgi:carbon monoxide dehydrogenase subunit G
MELQGERLIPAPIDRTWAALNDPDILAGCIAGCESLVRTGDNAFAAVLALKIGPVSARFKGNLQMTDVEAPHGYTMNFDGQGGVAGFGKGSADVVLIAEADQTRLRYNARATVGGKMAQIGSRLVDATAAKITDDFFKAFAERLQTVDGPTDGEALAPAGGAHATVKAAAPSGRSRAGAVWWTIGAIVVLGALYFLTR